MPNADALARCQDEPMTLSMPDVVESVLRAHSKGAPMHYRRITELAIAEGLIEPQGLTPEALAGRHSVAVGACSSGESACHHFSSTPSLRRDPLTGLSEHKIREG